MENVSESAIVLNEANDDAEEEESVSVEKDNKDDEAICNKQHGWWKYLYCSGFIYCLFVC